MNLLKKSTLDLVCQIEVADFPGVKQFREEGQQMSAGGGVITVEQSGKART